MFSMSDVTFSDAATILNLARRLAQLRGGLEARRAQIEELLPGAPARLREPLAPAIEAALRGGRAVDALTAQRAACPPGDVTGCELLQMSGTEARCLTRAGADLALAPLADGPQLVDALLHLAGRLRAEEPNRVQHHRLESGEVVHVQALAGQDGGPATCALSRGPAGPGPRPRLTPRELEVARLVASGWSDLEIADHLGRSRATVKSHLRNLFRKTDARSRTHVVRRLLERGEG